MQKYIKWFEEVNLNDLGLVGGKNASLGELIKELSTEGVRVPSGFVITADAYTLLMDTGKRAQRLSEILSTVDKSDMQSLSAIGHRARALIKEGGLPEALAKEIRQAYRQLESKYGPQVDVAVRSSATAEDLPDASFAGQQESFLNICGEGALLEACLNCFASLFTDRAIAYRIDKGFDHLSVRLSIGVQKMVRSDLAVSGVIFTLDPESGFANTTLITSSYGLGENIVAGRVDPDEYMVFKPTLETSPSPIIRRKLGAKQIKMIYCGHGTRSTTNVDVPPEQRRAYSLSDEEVLFLARWATKIEKHYSSHYGRQTHMDIEWAKDGKDGHLYIVQARPETVHSQRDMQVVESYELKQQGEVLLTGRSIGQKIATGKVRVIRSASELQTFVTGEVLVTDMTDPDWEPVMKRASGIITNRGGRTCHAAIISRELGVACVVGTERATQILTTGDEVTVHCSGGAQGYVFRGVLPFTKTSVHMDQLPSTRTKVMVNVGNPEHAFQLSFLPVQGVGLAREEFIIADEVKVHPLALTRLPSIKDAALRQRILEITAGYAVPTQYFIDKLAEGIAMIAAAFYPREVIVRLSDFKTNEYANLIGGHLFEPVESNPMIGFRGACRYYDERYRDGFRLECQSLLKVREEMGLSNVKIMVPFCRTTEEAQLVLHEMASHGLVRGKNGLEVYIMCELPSNVFAIDEFAELFDGFSIGSNDLTQLTLGLDRDSELVSHLFDERNPAVKTAISAAIAGAHRHNRKIGICGQAPSDYPDFVEFLVAQGIDSISLNEDVVIKTMASIQKAESQASEHARLAVVN